ncbi:MAG: 16S rRNA (cytidine(1402)-2'-O)-methyltransferase [Lautropia sp.]|nr:16S rRNA (cytidine(1402)-2'-O)-methyltransferase [Lautropia sp.]
MPSCLSAPVPATGPESPPVPEAFDLSVPSGMPAALYVVATPIGNLEDISSRAIRTLRSVSWIAAEDTRSSRPLLQSLGIGTARCLSLHAHNEAQQLDRVLDHVRAGQSVALISDAGTPGISDPGALLVSAAHMAGIPVVPVPGPSAATTLISAAGLPGGRFLFEGFLPTRPKQRRERLAHLLAERHAFMLFEPPHRIEALAAELQAEADPTREIVIGRELTKRFEQIVRLPVAELGTWLSADPNHRRGEFAMLVMPAPSAADTGEAPADTPSELGIQAMKVLADEMPPRQAAKLAAKISGDKPNLLYQWHSQR